MTPPRLRQSPIARQAQDVVEILNESKMFREAAAEINRAFTLEDRDWEQMLGGVDHEGPTLDSIKAISAEVRQAMLKPSVAPLVNRGAQLRHSYVWSKGVKLPEPPTDAKPGPKGAEALAHEAIAHAVNQNNVFSGDAHEEMERALYSDGSFFLLGDKATRLLRRVPLTEITGFITNPDFADEVWAWRRSWKSHKADGSSTTEHAWYYVADCPEPVAKRPKKIDDDRVDGSKEFLVKSVNRHVGWPLGIPDAIAIVAWAKLYSEFMKYGYIMNRALATIAFTATPKTKTQGEKAAVRMASATGAGQTAIGANVSPVATAGKGYDFDAGRPLAALAATSVQVSIVHLLSDPGAAGSSYGSASNLDAPQARAIQVRQKSWARYLESVLKWLGLKDPEVSFPSLEDPDFYREMQGIILGWNSGVLHEEEVRTRLISLLNILTSKTEAPSGVMVPNNVNSILRPDVDGDGSPSSTASPDQGTSKGTGKARDSHDLESASEAFNRLEISEKLERVLEALGRD